MTAIFRTPYFRTEVAASFIEEMADINSRLYAMIGRENDPKGTKYADGSIFSDGDGLWLDDTAPPAPENSTVYDRQLWDMAIAGKYLENQDILFVVPRTNNISRNHDGSSTTFDYSILWDDVKDATEYPNPASRVYDPYSFTTTSGDNNFEAHNILINSDREVWLCVARGDDIDNPADPGDDFVLSETSGDVPYLNLHSGDIVEDTQFFEDGTVSILTLGTRANNATSGAESKYTWKFICRINENIWNAVVNEQTDWIPMNFDSIVETDEFDQGGTYGDIDTQDAIGNGNSPFILGLRHVLLRSLLRVSSIPGDGLPGNLNFRQVFIVRDPKDHFGNLAQFNYGYMPNSNPDMSPVIDSAYTDSGNYTLDPGDPNDPQTGDIETFTKYTGRILYVENRQPIYRQDDQTEEIFTIFSY